MDVTFFQVIEEKADRLIKTTLCDFVHISQSRGGRDGVNKEARGQKQVLELRKCRLSDLKFRQCPNKNMHVL